MQKQEWGQFNTFSLFCFCFDIRRNYQTTLQPTMRRSPPEVSLKENWFLPSSHQLASALWPRRPRPPLKNLVGPPAIEMSLMLTPEVTGVFPSTRDEPTLQGDTPAVQPDVYWAVFRSPANRSPFSGIHSETQRLDQLKTPKQTTS